jgi:hypothetical protein
MVAMVGWYIYAQYFRLFADGSNRLNSIMVTNLIESILTLSYSTTSPPQTEVTRRAKKHTQMTLGDSRTNALETDDKRGRGAVTHLALL